MNSSHLFYIVPRWWIASASVSELGYTPGPSESHPDKVFPTFDQAREEIESLHGDRLEFVSRIDFGTMIEIWTLNDPRSNYPSLIPCYFYAVRAATSDQALEALNLARREESQKFKFSFSGRKYL